MGFEATTLRNHYTAASKSNIANRCIYINFCLLPEFKIDWIVFAGTFTSALKNSPLKIFLSFEYFQAPGTQVYHLSVENQGLI